MSELINRITIAPAVCNGQPTIRRKRITVRTILEFLSAGDVLRQYPSPEQDDIRVALEFGENM